MYPMLALQAAAVGLALFVTSLDAPVVTVRDRPQHAVRTPAPSDAPRLRCRLYFGCTPVPLDSRSGYSQ